MNRRFAVTLLSALCLAACGVGQGEAFYVEQSENDLASVSHHTGGGETTSYWVTAPDGTQVLVIIVDSSEDSGVDPGGTRASTQDPLPVIPEDDENTSYYWTTAADGTQVLVIVVHSESASSESGSGGSTRSSTQDPLPVKWSPGGDL